jgi:hypothetical protein
MAQNGSWNMKAIIATKFILAATPIRVTHFVIFPIFEIYIFIKHFLIVLICANLRNRCLKNKAMIEK